MRLQSRNDKRWNRKIFLTSEIWIRLAIEELPSKYLMHKIKCRRSPNTVKRSAFAICYYMGYMEEKEMELTEVYQLGLRETDRAFCGFSILAQSRKSHEAIQWKNEEMSKSRNLQRIFKRCVQVLFYL